MTEVLVMKTLLQTIEGTANVSRFVPEAADFVEAGGKAIRLPKLPLKLGHFVACQTE